MMKCLEEIIFKSSKDRRKTKMDLLNFMMAFSGGFYCGPEGFERRYL
jgi:hypothetical protein